MRKYENFCNCFRALEESSREKCNQEIYRMGVVGQFNLSFELAWKALQAVLQMHSVKGAESGSPREIIRLGFHVGFLQDEEAWLSMLKKRNTATHIYNEDEILELIPLIYEAYIPVLQQFRDTMQEKIAIANEGLK